VQKGHSSNLGDAKEDNGDELEAMAETCGEDEREDARDELRPMVKVLTPADAIGNEDVRDGTGRSAVGSRGRARSRAAGHADPCSARRRLAGRRSGRRG
jgi:hypothetical protein